MQPFSYKSLLSHFKAFWLSLLCVFIVMSLHMIGVTPPSLVSPLPIKQDVFKSIVPKLQKKVSIFSVNTSNEQAPIDDADATHAYGVLDFENGTLLSGKNVSASYPIASLTKIMSAVVALDLADPSETFTVTKSASQTEPTKIGVVPGEHMELRELLDAALLTSANDAVEVIKQGIDSKYGYNVFVRAMNEKARFLKLHNTHFDNPQGFDSSGNFSSVEDLSILAHYALTQYPLIADIVQKEYMFLPANAHHKQFDLYNWNGLLGVYPHVLGFKTGVTTKAGDTTVVVSEREGKKMLAVVLGSPGILQRDLIASQLLDLGFEKSQGLAPFAIYEDQLYQKYHTWKYWN